MTTYLHTVQYYETDRMGITHHSNYIRWMEEARTDWCEQLGYPYARWESEGVGSPVIGVSFEYKASTTYSDRVSVETRITSFNGVILQLGYTMQCNGRLVGTGTSRHTFVETNGRISRLKRDHAELYELLVKAAEQDQEKA